MTDRTHDERDDVTTLRVEAQGATSVTARLRMAVGSLRLRGGATALLDLRAEHTPGMAPEATYEVRDGQGWLEVTQPKAVRSLRLTRNRWDVRLSDALPLDLEIDLAAGEAEVVASTLRLRHLTVDHNAGEAELRAGGEQPELERVHADVAAGELELDLTGRYASLRAIDVEVAAGQVALDLRGRWACDCDVAVDAAAGEVTLRLPAGMRVEVDARATLGRVRTRGLAREGGRWVAGPPQGPALRVHARAAIGQVTVEVTA